jgi:hypothetical protein
MYGPTRGISMNSAKEQLFTVKSSIPRNPVLAKKKNFTFHRS